MPAIPFLADALRRLPGPKDQRQGSDEVAVCQLPFGQASDNAHLPNERLGIRQVEKVRQSGLYFYVVAPIAYRLHFGGAIKVSALPKCLTLLGLACLAPLRMRAAQGVDVLACTLESLAARLAGEACEQVAAP